MTSITQAKTGVEVERLPELPPIPEGDRFADQTKFRKLGEGGGEVLYECWAEAIRAYATASLAAERAEAVRLMAALRDAIFELEFSGMAYDHPKLISLRAALSPSQQGEPK